jgi:Cohesin domain
MLRVVSANASPGGRVAVSIEMTGRGDELATSFTFTFDPKKLSDPRVELGPEVSPGTVLTINSGSAAKGMLAILLDSNEPVNRSTWTPKLLTITFDVARSAQAGPTSLTFSDTLARRSMSDADGNSILSNFEDGVVNISPISR